MENIRFLTSKIKMIRGNKELEFSGALIRKEELNISAVSEFFHNSELKHLENLKYERRKWNYVLGRLSAKLAVKKLLNVSPINSICIDSGVFGFPVVKCPEVKNIQVSITHSGTLGMSIAFKEKHPMGIDIEEICPGNNKTILSQITEEEKALLKKVDMYNIAAFTTIWCAKEALSKVLKTGMMLNFSFLEIDKIETEGQTTIYKFKNFGQYKALCYTNKMYAVAIVLPRNTSVNLEEFWDIFNIGTVLYE